MKQSAFIDALAKDITGTQGASETITFESSAMEESKAEVDDQDNDATEATPASSA